MNQNMPLAERMRPQNFEEFVGQEHIVGKGKILRQLIEHDQLSSLILWGPAGTGKTSIAKIIANTTKAHFIPISAVSAGVEQIKKAVAEAKDRWQAFNQKTILFIDEIHRFNKAQQDLLLPYVEKAIIIVIGATTENPYFEVIAPLVSRSRIFHLEPLSDKAIETILKRALKDEKRGLGKYKLKIDPEALKLFIKAASGDARAALNTLEWAFLALNEENPVNKKITLEMAQEATQKRLIKYDKKGEEHYDTISAFIKSMRGSNPDAALYWLVKMLEAGEDPKFIARRIVIAASEDVGNADPQALVIANAAFETVMKVGLPEAEFALAQAAVYVACAPKSNSIKEALYNTRNALFCQEIKPIVPKHLRNPVVKGLAKEGYGVDYKYPHDFPGHFVEQEYLPEGLENSIFYKPSDQGFEKIIKERLEYWRKKNKKS
ncbi:MAG: replication-associated recombination protein A [Candidatus Nanoarchaeia archaeon]